jgi:hypothetical protein
MIQNFFGHSPRKILPHPSYFPGVFPLEFYLFGKVKSALLRREIPDEIDPLEIVIEILNGVSDAELQHVFRRWIHRVERIIQAGGGYLTM